MSLNPLPKYPVQEEFENSPPFDSEEILALKQDNECNKPPIHSLRVSRNSNVKAVPQDDLTNPGRESVEGNFTESFR